jgi:two-component system, chemotaxis family, protein-glutamate methylesterase/glutaminase
MPGATAGHDIVVVGASAGGIEALEELVGGLPADLPAAVFVVLHLPAGGTSVLPHILSRAGPLPAEHVVGGVEIERGHIYVAPPDCHLQINDRTAQAVAGPKENGHRPAIDPLFRSAAHVFGPRAVGVILSGTLDDGTLGMRAIKAHGGVGLVQDPETALHAGMPRSAIEYAAPDRIGSPTELAQLIVELANDPIENGNPGGKMNANHSEEVAKQTEEHPQPGEATGLTCPECGGAIWRSEEENVVSLRCRVGHKYTAETFALDQGRTVEAAVWASLRLIEERVVLMRQLAERFKDQPRTSGSFQEKADELEQHAVALRSVVEGVAGSVAITAGRRGGVSR